MRNSTKKFKLMLAVSMGLGLVLAVTLMVMPASADVAGTDYYVNAATGSDVGNTGGVGDPWETITHAVSAVPAGATGDPNVIHVAAGLYDATNNGEVFPIVLGNANVSLVGDGAGATIIDGEGAMDVIGITAPGITVQGFTIQNAIDDGVDANIGGFTIQNNTFITVEYGVNLDIDEVLASTYVVTDVAVISNTFTVTDTGVRVEIVLDGDNTASTVVISDVNVLSNTFTVLSTAGEDDGVYFADIWVEYLDGGQITVGGITISANEFYSGYDGIDLFDGSDYGGFQYLTDTVVTVGDIIITDNVFQNQVDEAIEIDCYEADYWYTTTATFGNLVIDDNDIDNTGNDGIEISHHVIGQIV